jgi:arylsulfatase A-like enzyme
MYSDPEKVKYFISEYYAMVKEVDDWVGKILDKLDALGLSENTLVIFTSDHGEMLGSHGMRGKFNFYEESSHIPMLIRFPGRIKSGTVVDEYISTVNIFATILDYLNIPERPSDGFSMKGLIEGTDDKNPKYVVTEWLSELKTAPSHMVLKDGWKLMLPDSSATGVMKALYNLNDDPFEMNNLLGSNQDAGSYNDRVDDLETCFREWMAKTDRSQN